MFSSFFFIGKYRGFFIYIFLFGLGVFGGEVFLSIIDRVGFFLVFICWGVCFSIREYVEGKGFFE